ncbi:hypothetical protein A2625_06725 [candidate division WOR-1 bacterium RIFCSPHIGHO2_01_FULL_53_15]|uniref:Uncharacterized protein n=1 Tax=candidate division WOR-1 bacterium RIFCSPHIGHO2_01_FULL_53_15 TaxID=1802564 RepID=A0A1F4Q535_UNCSA|nr:MAG: hypothetical protein A2625_06725 [candidate division WOR-1 bacterium RIFCSPHIGHO2_01_FULL_53_15]OGC10298.1 MAG: hypothetical protein A3D23_06730 [candidate division WOR-1 bacterium RIFCSPHIGHO2_02_FULL_53_26]
MKTLKLAQNDLNKILIRKALEEVGASDQEIAQTLGIIRAFNLSEPIIYLEDENYEREVIGE